MNHRHEFRAVTTAALVIAMGGAPLCHEITAHGRVAPIWAVPELPAARERDNREEFPPRTPKVIQPRRWPTGFP